MEKPIILVVDDEDIIELVKLNLAREDYRMLACTTGEKALEIAGWKRSTGTSSPTCPTS
jgi:DNA-binding response OmpR family regulator